MIMQLLPIIMSLLINLLPPIMTLATTLLPIIFQLIQTLLPPITQLAAAILPIFVQLLQQLLPPVLQIVQAVLPVLVSLITALLPVISPLLELITPILQVVLMIITPLLDLINYLLPAITDLITRFIVPALQIVIIIVQSVVQSFVNAWAGVKSAWSALPGFFSGIWSGLKASAQEVVTVLFEFFSGAWDKIKGVYNAVAGFFTGIFTDAWNGIKNAFSEVEGFFQGVFNTIKSLFKTPHFTFSGSLNPLDWDTKGTPKINVQWYKKGGVMLDPTLFGFNGNSPMVGGEDGPEAVAPIETLKKYISEAVSDNAQASILSAILEYLKGSDDRLYTLIVEALTSGVKFEVDGREFGRLVRSYA
jgi:hypothetical protein